MKKKIFGVWVLTFILEKIEKDIYKRKYKLIKSNSCDRKLIELKLNYLYV